MATSGGLTTLPAGPNDPVYAVRTVPRIHPPQLTP